MSSSFTEKLRTKSASLVEGITGSNKNKVWVPESEDEGENLLGKNDNSLTLWGGVLATLSFMVGGGICSISYCMNQTGILYVTFLCLFMNFQGVNRTWLYLEAKDLLPGKPESFFEMGYIMFGRKSIFIICCFMVPNSFGMTIALMQMGGTTLQHLMKDLFEHGFGWNSEVDR